MLVMVLIKSSIYISSKALYSHRLEQENDRAAAVESVERQKESDGDPKTQVAILLLQVLQVSLQLSTKLDFIG